MLGHNQDQRRSTIPQLGFEVALGGQDRLTAVATPGGGNEIAPVHLGPRAALYYATAYATCVRRTPVGLRRKDNGDKGFCPLPGNGVSPEAFIRANFTKVVFAVCT